MSTPLAPDLVIRPSAQNARRMLKTTPIVLLVFVAFMVLRNGLAGLVIALATALVAAALLALFVKQGQVIVTASQLIRVGLFGLRRTRERSQISAVVNAPMPASALDARVYRNLFVLDQLGKPIIRLRDSHWAEADLQRLVDALGVAPVGPDRVVTAKELAEVYPKAVPWLERRPWLAAFTIAGGLIVGGIIVAIIVVAATS